VLRPWARAVVTAWVLIVVPVLLATTVLMVLALPRLIGTAVASLGDQAELLGEQFGDGDALGVMVRLLSLVAIALPVLGTLYIIARVVRQVVTRTWRATDGRPGRRAVAGVAAMAVLAGLAWAWWPEPGAYRPIQAYERGAVQDALPTSLRGVAPASLVEGRGGRAQTIWPADVELPSADSPQLAVVLVPRGTTDGQQEPGQQGAGAAAGQEAPTWVFPFNRPLPPGEGDNQALAVNTTDGGTVYDVAFALVWADGDSVLNTNEAYALASCKECQTVAVAFQVVLVVGQVDVVVPQNLSAAVNYSCVECVTYALATQLVLSLPESLDPRSLAELEALWREIAAFGASLEGVPLSELQARLSAFEAQILEIVRTDPGAAPAGEPTDQATASAPADGQSGTTAPAATGGATAPRPSATTSAQEQEAAPTSTSTSSPVATVTSSPTATEEPTAAATATSTAAPETTAP